MQNAGWGCGCEYEPITIQEKAAILEKKEKMLQEKLNYIQKMREELKTEKAIKT